MASSQEIIYIGFNQDSSSIVISTEIAEVNESKIKVYNISTPRCIFCRVFPGTFGIVELLYRSNIIGLVGGGKSSRYPPNKLVIWDDHQLRPISELMFKNEIKSVKLRKNSVVVVLESKIYVYNLRDLRLKDTFKTFRNPKGLCCLTTDANQEVIAFPYEDRGKVLIKFYNDDLTSCIDAHENTIACMALNPDGSLLATASDKGTLVRIFNTATQDQVKELRRGIDRAEIYCLCFHFTSQWIACSSNTGTVHVYSIMSSVPNPDLGLGIFKKVLPKYFDSQWSYSQFRVRDSKTICTFLMDRPVLVVVTDDAMHHEINFLDPGHCTEGTVTNLLELDIV